MRSGTQKQVWTGYLYLRIGLGIITMYSLFTPTPTPPTAPDPVDESLKEDVPQGDKYMNTSLT